MRHDTLLMLLQGTDNFQCLMESIGIGVALINTDMEVLDVNHQMKKWFPQVEQISKPICYRSFNNPAQDEICTHCPVRKTFCDGKSHETAKAARAGLTARSFRVVSTPVRDAAGKIIAALELFEDTSEWWRTAERIAQAQNEFKQIFDAAGNGMRVVDADYKIIRVNKAFTALAGASEEELLGRKCYESFTCPQCASPKCCVSRVLNSEECFIMEVERERPDGGRYWCLVGSAALRDPTGQLTGIVQNFIDISDRKLIEKALQESECNLKKQKLELEKANIALKVLLSKIEQEKHEFEEQVAANIVSLVEPYVKKLKNTGLSPRQQTYLKLLEANLQDVISPLVRTALAMHLRFSPMEILISRLVKQGKTSKEIAELLNLSPRTIEKHRRNIRKKVGITNEKINLQTLLSTCL